MKKIGITGGIGSGKSIIASFLECIGIPVYYTDIEAKKISDTSLVVREKLTDKFGGELYKNNILDKKMLASLIFSDDNNLSFVNAVIHPLVIDHFLAWSNKFISFPYIAIESAILFESYLNQYVDVIWTVYAPLDIRVERVMKREKITINSVLERIKKQLPEEEKNKLSDYIIYNDNIQAVIPQIEKIINEIEIN